MSFQLDYRVRIGDINYGGHVSNAAVLEFFQEARLAFLAANGNRSEMDVGQGCGLILTEAHVSYAAEMFHGDLLTIRVTVNDIGRSRFVLAYVIERDGQVTATGTTTMVCFNYSRRKVQRLTDPFVESLRAATVS